VDEEKLVFVAKLQTYLPCTYLTLWFWAVMNLLARNAESINLLMHEKC